MRTLALGAAALCASLLLGLSPACSSGETGTGSSTGGAGTGSSTGGAGAGPSTGGADAGSDAPVGPMPGQDASVVAFDHTPIYFTGSDNQREVDKTATFPAEGSYQTITL